jgi:hypothetical protein
MVSRGLPEALPRLEEVRVEFIMLGAVCFVVGGLAGGVFVLVMAALVAGGRADDRMEEWNRNRKGKE